MGTLTDRSVLPESGTELFGEYDGIIAFASAVILMLAITSIDKLTGYDIHLGVLHVIPVAIATWFAGRTWGFALCAVAIGLWMFMFRAHAGSAAHYWDAAVLLTMLLIVSYLISRLHEELHRSDERLVKVLEEIDAPLYVADPRQKAILYGNRRFRDAHAERSFESLDRLPAHECAIRWPDGRRVRLRILNGRF